MVPILVSHNTWAFQTLVNSARLEVLAKGIRGSSVSSMPVRTLLSFCSLVGCQIQSTTGLAGEVLSSLVRSSVWLLLSGWLLHRNGANYVRLEYCLGLAWVSKKSLCLSTPPRMPQLLSEALLLWLGKFGRHSVSSAANQLAILLTILHRYLSRNLRQSNRQGYSPNRLATATWFCFHSRSTSCHWNLFLPRGNRRSVSRVYLY